MNYLAHFHLAWPDEALVIGGLEGEFFKGRLEPLKPDALPDSLIPGVKLHRAIDAFTDQHVALNTLREQFPQGVRRYAGILIDLAFDHYLSKHWADFAALELERFTNEVYRLLHRDAPLLSPSAQRMASRLVDYDVLSRYRDWEMVHATAARIGERLTKENPLNQSDALLTPHKALLEECFLSFYPDLQRYCEETVILLGSIHPSRN